MTLVDDIRRSRLWNGVHVATLAVVLALTVVWEYRWREQVRLLHARNTREDELIQRAFHDELTNLPNRALLRERLEHAFTRAQRHNHPLGLLFLDLDHFKTINDYYGHSVGDQVLATVAERLRQTLRGSDTVARLGGDEFLVLLEDLETEHAVREIAARLAASCQAPLQIGSQHIGITVSIGGIVSALHHDTSDALIREADTALHDAKRAGKAQAVIFQQSSAN